MSLIYVFHKWHLHLLLLSPHQWCSPLSLATFPASNTPCTPAKWILHSCCHQEWTLRRQVWPLPWALGRWSLILGMPGLVRVSLFTWGLWTTQDTLTMWFMGGASGQAVSAWLPEGQRMKVSHAGGETYLHVSPNKISVRQGSGELPRRAILHIYCHTSLLAEASAVQDSTGRGQQEILHGILDSAPCTSSTGWLQSVCFYCNKPWAWQLLVSSGSPSGELLTLNVVSGTP